ncbi:MAG: hypothetical protein KIT31_35600 [Deltaproteobacteria bacterium]|nr:hypothetical protein [Deltaproteobacteria bacterium]
MRRLFPLALLFVASCTLYFDKHPRCDVADDVAFPFDPNQLRDPSTGECHAFGGGGCGDSCAPCALERAPLPDWGQCFSACDALDEAACLTRSGCRAAYLQDLARDRAPEFFGCWDIAPSGPERGSCQGLDAQACSRHDDCAGLYAPGVGGGRFFVSCLAEQGLDACALVDCIEGFHCEQQCTGAQCQPMCVPDHSACAAADCGPGLECVDVCTPPPAGCEPGTPGTCHAECRPTPTCEASQSEAECTSRPSCTPVYLGEDCTCTPAGCTCEIKTYDRCRTK